MHDDHCYQALAEGSAIQNLPRQPGALKKEKMTGPKISCGPACHGYFTST
ncbi:hypothetical protein ACQPT2_02780 [Erwinia amylovora]